MMELNDEKKTQAEYDRFIDLMAQMYLKYGTKYRTLKMAEVMKLFPEHQCGKKNNFQEGA